jgi:plasmid stabilization system protein ParE
MEIVFTERFVTALEECIDFIAQDDPQVAIEWSKHILDRCDQIANYPKSGRVVPEIGLVQIRELIDGNYRIVYEMSDKQVIILLIWSSRKKMDDNLIF